MAWVRTWRGRFFVGILIGAAAVFIWIRREAHIASTPVVVIDMQEDPVPLSRDSEEASADERRHAPATEEPIDETPQRDSVQREVTTPSSPLTTHESGEQRAPSSVDPSLSPSSPTVRTASVRLDVPFVSQAPFRVWSLPYKEYCEEASAFTLHLWKEGKRTPPADELDRQLRDIQAWEEMNLGRWNDTNADETARILREKFGHANTRVVQHITSDDIRREIDAGRPVIVPARGRELDSPYFTPPGPVYHMLVIIGYDDAAGQWITNDVGTNTKGAGQRYAYDDLYDAIADWSHVDEAPTGEKVMVVLD